MHSAGVTYNFLVGTSGIAGTPYVTYNPRLNYNLSDDLSVSLTSYVSLGFSGSANSQTGSTLAFGVDVPVLVQLNWGHHATKDTDKAFGIHAAAGYDFNILGAAGAGIGMLHGLSANVGVKFGIGEKVSLGFRGTYTYALQSAHIFGIGALWNF